MAVTMCVNHTVASVASHVTDFAGVCETYCNLERGYPRSAPLGINLRKSPSSSVGATLMVARGRGVLPVHLAHRKEQGHLPSPAGDHQGRPYGSSGLLPLFMIEVDAYWVPESAPPRATARVPSTHPHHSRPYKDYEETSRAVSGTPSSILFLTLRRLLNLSEGNETPADSPAHRIGAACCS